LARAARRPATFDFETALERADAEPRGTPALLLRAAARLFAERGFDAVRTREVAAAARVNVATLHFHWRDKVTLYQAVLRDCDRSVLAFFASLEKASSQREISLDEQIESWIQFSFEFMTRHPEAARLRLRWFVQGSPPGVPDDLAREVGLLRYVAGVVESRMARPSRDESMLIVLLVLIAGLFVFSDSSAQRELLGGSLARDPELRGRVAAFARDLLRRLLAPPPTPEPKRRRRR
jgi:AcrR family transcriptional regulator